jgi:two-component system sensor histidine kinase HydH
MKTPLRARFLQIPSGARAKSAWLLFAVALLLPLILVSLSLLTARETEKLRTVLLRNRAANIAARLETVAPDELQGNLLEVLAAEEPAILDVQINTAPGSDPNLEPIWSGRELYRTIETADTFTAYIPFHSENRLRVARIDLAASAADVLLRHAWHMVTATLFAASVLTVLGLYGIWTARRLMRLESLARLGQLSAVLAHEIRNPLGTIKGFTQLACEQQPTAGPFLEPALDEVRRLENLVNDLLLFGREQTPHPRPVRWAEVVRTLEPHAREAIGQKSIAFIADTNDFTFATDPDLLRQVLLNLIRNSIDALDGSGGHVRLTAGTSPGTLTIAVEDDGPGISESARVRLFEPFQSAKANGAGLGLSISKKLVETLGGRLRLINVEPHGARAEITLHGKPSGY